jgi:hypothetical protein
MKKRGRTWTKVLGSIATIVAFGACDIGGCGGCVSPLPQGVSLPADQTVEGGAQIRITPTGFQTLTDIIPDAVNDALGDGFCIGRESFSIIDVCHRNNCTGGVQGCQVNFNTDFIDLSVPNNNTLRVNAQFDVGTTVFAEADLGIFGSPDCNIIVTANNTRFDANIGVGINGGTGELQINLQSINNVTFNPNIDASDCGAVIDAFGSLVSNVLGILDDFLNSFLGDLITPLLDDLIQGLLPDPLGILGMLDGSSLIPGVSQETNASMELRVVPGGYAFIEGSGMSLGVITGINADEDQSTRSTDLDSEPALCVPPIPQPDFAAAPASLPTSSRGNFALQGAGAFRGSPDPAGADLIMGASETMLDQLGHHLVTSGGLCLGIGPEVAGQLNVGTLGLLVPSLAELGSDEGTDPLLLVTRPQAAIDFTIGEGTDTDPSLTMHLDGFEIDFYAFLFERYTRAFTLSLTVNAGVNLEFTLDADGNPALAPTLVGLDAASIGIEVINAEFLRENPADLEAVLPTLLDALLPQLTGALGPIALPDFAGFTLSNLSVTKVTTSEDDFLSLTAELGQVSPLLAQTLERFPTALARLEARAPRVAYKPVSAPARVIAVDVPEPARVRDALLGNDGGAMPEVSLSLATHDEAGRPLEWSYNLDGGIWRPFSSASPLVIRDRAFAIQGRYTINLHSRVIGDYTTTSLEPIEIPVVIDSAPPRIHTHRASRAGDTIAVPVNDLVSPRESVMVAFGTPGGDGPSTGWSPLGQLSAATADKLANGNRITVYAKDERGNVGAKDLDLEILGFHGTGDGGGCDCSSTQSAGSLGGMLLCFGVAMLIGFRRRLRVRLLGSTTGIALIAAVIAIGAGACNCGNEAGPPLCEDDEDLVCLDEAMSDCVCVDSLRFGRIGQYSEMAVGPDGSYWVSAYNSTHGDLMVVNTIEQGRIPDEAWEFVDGVPDGPVAIPDSDIRGGIREAGPDVGLYTDIAVSDAGDVIVSYFDADSGALRVAVNTAGAWTIHEVDDGVLGTTETGFEVAGQYSAIALDSAGNPSVAYFVHLAENSERRTEVRLARASTPTPTAVTDWSVSVVEAAPVPGNGEDNLLTIPEGNGLFINLAMRSDDTPVVAYYDRINGDLKLAEGDASGELTISVLDGVDSDVGWYPGIALDSSDVAHVSYVSSSNDDVLYINTADLTAETVDNGYRIVGQTEDGLPKPEFHFVGDDSAVVLSGVGPLVIYQDATTHELLLAQKNGAGNWIFETIAGNEETWAGAYGFYASGALQGENVVMSTWVVDQQNNQVWVEIFSRQVAVQ